LKLKCDEPLSNFAFNVNLRRYTQVVLQAAYANNFLAIDAAGSFEINRCTVGRYRSNTIKTRVESASGLSA